MSAISSLSEQELLNGLQFYRNRYFIGETSTAHHFTVYYKDKNNFKNTSHFQATNPSDVGPDQFQRVYSRIGIPFSPPTDLPTFPSSFGPIAEAIEKYILNEKPQSSQFYFKYEGFYRLIDLHEIFVIPHSTGERKIRWASDTFKVQEGQDPVFTSLNAQSGLRSLNNCYGTLLEPGQLPSFIPFDISPQLQGKLLLWPNRNDASVIEHQRLLEVAAKAVTDQDNKVFQNYWKTIVAMPKKMLPPNFVQQATFAIICHARFKQGPDTMKSFTVVYSVAEASKGTVSKTIEIADLKFTLLASLSFAEKKLIITAGREQHPPEKVEFSLNGTLLADGEEVVMTGDWNLDLPPINFLTPGPMITMRYSEEDPIQRVILSFARSITGLSNN